ncbi:MAG: cadmium-translocating P-type ATPase [Anaerolinea sp.]|nr:cadmium-translocating P-type ATPase [Anaerolinea sp.]
MTHDERQHACGDTGCPADEPARAGEPERLIDVPAIRRSVVAGGLLGAGLLAGWLRLGPIEIVALAGALLVGGSTFVPESLRGLLHRQIGVGTLMTTAALGAVLLGEISEAATLAFLFSISEGLEGYALARTRRELRALLDLVPPTATVLRAGREETIPAEALRLDDRMIVRPGERIATDGVIRAGRSSLDVSAITGESMPIEGGPGDAVYAGTINGGGALEIEPTALVGDNSLARIVRIVEAAQERKGRGQRLADRIARPLVPGIIVIASAVAVVGSLLGDPGVWLPRSLVVLVAAAPCAFAISVPVSVVAAIGSASRSGILIKGGAALETLAGIRVVALDKTGTLTRNEPRVTRVMPAAGVDAAEVLRAAAALEARSEHPLARAVLAVAPDIPVAEDVMALAGQGLTGRVAGVEVRLGRPSFVSPGVLAGAAESLEAEGATVVIVERGGVLLGLIGIRDELRPEAGAAVRAIRRLGAEVVMLTGDNERTAATIAAEAGIARVHAGLLPAQKASLVEELRRSGPTAMVGDGINDAPALATADVGIAMGAMGTDVAIETADVALMGDDLRHVPQAILHARRARTVMRQNLILSGSILVVLVPLAATGALGLAAVVAAHEIAEVLVIANGLRARRATPLPGGDRGVWGETSPGTPFLARRRIEDS